MTEKIDNKQAKPRTSGRTKPQKKDFRNLTMSLKDEADATKRLYGHLDE